LEIQRPRGQFGQLDVQLRCRRAPDLDNPLTGLNISYDPDGLLNLTDANNNKTGYFYDPRDRIVEPTVREFAS
jgi:YD repeat-containing protein